MPPCNSAYTATGFGSRNECRSGEWSGFNHSSRSSTHNGSVPAWSDCSVSAELSAESAVSAAAAEPATALPDPGPAAYVSDNTMVPTDNIPRGPYGMLTWMLRQAQADVAAARFLAHVEGTVEARVPDGSCPEGVNPTPGLVHQGYLTDATSLPARLHHNP